MKQWIKRHTSTQWNYEADELCNSFNIYCCRKWVFFSLSRTTFLIKEFPFWMLIIVVDGFTSNTIESSELEYSKTQEKKIVPQRTLEGNQPQIIRTNTVKTFWMKTQTHGMATRTHNKHCNRPQNKLKRTESKKKKKFCGKVKIVERFK